MLLAIERCHRHTLPGTYLAEVAAEHVELDPHFAQVGDHVQRVAACDLADLDISVDNQPVNGRRDGQWAKAFIGFQAREHFTAAYVIACVAAHIRDDAREPRPYFRDAARVRVHGACQIHGLDDRPWTGRFGPDTGFAGNPLGNASTPFVTLVRPLVRTAIVGCGHADIERMRLENDAEAPQIVGFGHELENVAHSA